jgi:uncharacterized membrane-anchored protein
MTTLRCALAAALVSCSLHAVAQEESSPTGTFTAASIPKVKWLRGPSTATMGDLAEVQVPEGYVFAGAKDTRYLMKSMGNLVTDTEVGFLSPDSLDWFLVFEFDKVGYVKDEEKNSLDADAMMASIRKGSEASNRQRKKEGLAVLNVEGWETPPFYNEATHNLEWAIRLSDEEGHPVINHNVRILGRRGIMRVTLVCGAVELPAVLPQARDRLASYSYRGGEKYEEFAQGDQIAKYGLSALVVGGAAAAAVKIGLFKKLWKVIVVGVVALAASIKKLFRRNATT